jgi:hypothetical protein
MPEIFSYIPGMMLLVTDAGYTVGARGKFRYILGAKV